MPGRLLYTVALGRRSFGDMAVGLARSLKFLGDNTPRAILTNLEGFDWARHFDYVIPFDGSRDALEKLTALETTDADQIIAIDSDMLAFRRLDDIFNYCTGMPFAVQGQMVAEGRWHGGDLASVCTRFDRETVPLFNGGFLYYERSEAARGLIQSMRDVAADYDQYGFQRYRQDRPSEEVSIMLGLAAGAGWGLIPEEMDFQNYAGGIVDQLPIDIDVARGVCRYVVRDHRVRRVEPYLLHTLSLRHFPIYWRQLDTLAFMERYEETHRPLQIREGRRRYRDFMRFWYRHVNKRLG